MGEYIQILPIKKEDSKNKIITDGIDREPLSRGEVLSVGEGRHLADGTLIKPSVEVGDIVEYNPSLIVKELKDENYKVTIIINTHAIYGKYKSEE